MAMSQEQVKALDRLRQQLSQLAASVSTLRGELEIQDPLPTWDKLQEYSHALSGNLNRLMESFSTHAQFLKEAHAYPLTNFPGPSQEGMLGQLLRKKLDPSVEDWIRENTTKTQAGPEVNGGESHDGGLRNEELRDLWSSAAAISNGIVRPMYEEDGPFSDDYTIAEREAGVENVVTGLKRNLDRESEDDEDDYDDFEEDQMEDVMPNVEAANKPEEGIDPSLPPMPLDSVLRFITTGTVPGSGRINR